MKYSITQEQAISKMVSIHGDKYNYDKAVYSGVHGKMLVNCPVHGDFEVSYSNHTHKGVARGCPACGLLERARKRTKPVESFLHKAKDVHGDKYDYSIVDYKDTRTKVSIICGKHGVFEQSPEKHLAGQDCPHCAGNVKLDAKLFTSKAVEKHGDTYCYSLIEDEHFGGDTSYVPIICKEHGVFEQLRHNHLFGQGCPKCARFGFNVNKPGTLYVMEGYGGTFKVGITNRLVDVRAKEINKGGKDFKVIRTFYFDSGADCALIETITLRHLNSNYIKCAEVFSGSTECFENVDVNSVLSLIERNIEYGESQKGARPM